MISRNSPCSCGSGKRYKQCCGSAGVVPDYRTILSAALERQRAGDLPGAEALYRKVLEIQPDEPDGLHMLGVIHLQTGRAREAVELILRVASMTEWSVQEVRHNLALAIGAVLGDHDRNRVVARRIAYRNWSRRRTPTAMTREPLVSVVIPSYNHGPFIRDCLESVYRQSWQSLELIVIDDGSSDDSVDVIRRSLATCPFPHRFVTRGNRGAHATINEGIALATGDYVNILNSDDRFVPDRIARMVEAVAAPGADWGFSGVDVIDAEGGLAERSPGSMASSLGSVATLDASAPTIGFALLSGNRAISTGNLFFSKSFFARVGGFSDLRYNHDWDFALRATLASEPVYVPDALYQYRVHGKNTISESASAARKEADAMLRGHLRTLADSEAADNPFAPTCANWGTFALGYVLGHGMGAALPPEQLRELLALFVEAPARWSSADASAPLARLAEFRQVSRLLEAPDSGAAVEAPFDQYQRYAMAARAIEQLRQPGQVFSILEVGANTHKLLGRLLPMDRITYLDREIPPDMHDASDVVIGDATTLTMPDGSADIVVAMDVYEHIEPDRRAAFLYHITRVAGLLTVLGAPFAHPSVRDAEQAAMAFWGELFPHPYRWLAEHADNGLPDLAATRRLLDDMGVGQCDLGHGELSLWRELLKAHFAAEASPDLRPSVAAIDRYYRDHLFARDFSPGATYRTFLFCSRSAAVLDRMRLFRDGMAGVVPNQDIGAVLDVLQGLQAIAVAARPPGNHVPNPGRTQ